MTYRIIGIALVVCLVCACGKDDPFVPTEEDQEWPEYDFDSSVEPRVVEEIAREDYETVTLPMTITGEDNGDESILYSLMLGHNFLVANQRPEGDYLYEWLADTNEELDSSSRLQMHATAWSSVLLYRFIERDEHLIAAYRVAKKYIGDIRTEEFEGKTLASLGGALNSTAFYFFLLVELEDVMGEGEFTEVLDQMANYFEAQVDPEAGCIYTGFPHGAACDTIEKDNINAFAIGQGMVAMERLYRKTGDEKWLDLIEKAALYYYELNDGAANSEGGIYWSAWAGPPMVSLVLERPNEDIEGWIFAQADRWVTDQYTPGDPASRVGGFKKLADKIPTWSAVSEVEIIVDAYRLAKARGDEDRMASYKASGILAAEYLMSLQYRKDNVDEFDLADPDRAIGAYHFSNSSKASSISMHHVRSDYMDHFAVTLLKTISYLELPETYPGSGFATREN